nr:hypothetical protein [Tanacetum cinerariifolium]
TDYSRPSPTVESTSGDDQNKNSSTSENGESTDSILSKPAVMFVKAAERLTTNKVETVKNPSVRYAELYRKPSKKSTVRGNQQNWNNLKSQQLGNFVIKKKACYNCGHFDSLSYDYGLGVKRGTTRPQNSTHKSMPPRPVIHRPYRPPMRTTRPNLNAATRPYVNSARPQTTQELMIILIQRVQRLGRELKARTPVHKVDRGRSRPVMAWVSKKSWTLGEVGKKNEQCRSTVHWREVLFLGYKFEVWNLAEMVPESIWPSPTVESTSGDDQNKNSSTSENGESTDSILSKPTVKFVKAAERLTTNKVETVKNPSVRYAELYRKPSKKSTNSTHKSMPPRPVIHRPYRPPMRTTRPNSNAATRPYVNSARPQTTQELMIILIQTVQRLGRELKARTPVHKVDRGRSGPVMAWVSKKGLKYELRTAVRTQKPMGLSQAMDLALIIDETCKVVTPKPENQTDGGSSRPITVAARVVLVDEDEEEKEEDDDEEHTNLDMVEVSTQSVGYIVTMENLGGLEMPESQVHSDLDETLVDFLDVFTMLAGLPPSQNHEHTIVLKEEAGDLSLESIEDEEVATVDEIFEGAFEALGLEMEALVDSMEVMVVDNE